MADEASKAVAEWQVGEQGPLDMAVLFVDLVDSSTFASVLGLQSYADFLHSFGGICKRQAEYFLGEYLPANFEAGRDYDVRAVGDEVVVFMHTGNPANDVYLLIVLAITFKCAWLGAEANRERLERRISTSEIAVGLNFGKVWAERTEWGFAKEGYAINLAKRIESYSRTGSRFRICLSDGAFKQINLRMRNLLFGPRQLTEVKGILGSIGVYELYDTFVNPLKRLAPDIASDFSAVAEQALDINSRDQWIHSCVQVGLYHEHQRITDKAFALNEQVLHIDPLNPVALYHLAQGYIERDEMDYARILLERLTKSWPEFGDGWLSLGKLLGQMGKTAEAEEILRTARLCGIPANQATPEE